MPTTARHTWTKLYGCMAAVGFGALVIYVWCQRRPAFFDEPAHLSLAQSFAAAPSLTSWLVNNPSSAAGPLTPLLYHSLWPGNLPEAPLLRMPNLCLLAVVIATLAAALRRAQQSPWLAPALAAMALPTTWVSSGLALTEIPAMAGVTAAIYAAARLGTGADDPVRRTATRAVWLAMLAVGLAVATCGRQTYLVAAPAVALLAVRSRADWGPVAAAVVAGLLPIAAVMVVWGGLTPPLLRGWNEGLAPIHAVMAVCYAGGIALWLAPRFFRAHWRWVLAAAIAAMVANVAWFGLRLTLFTSVQRFVGHPALTRALETVAGGGLIAAGAGWLAALVGELRRRPTKLFIAGALGVLLLCAACAPIKHQFSSRYIGMALPFFPMMLAPWMDFGPWGCTRLGLGMAAGAAVLASYFRFAPG